MITRYRNGILFLAGGVAYPLLEMIWRGRTHYSMALAGGICLCAIDRICVHRMHTRPLAEKCAAGAGIITAVEFGIGVVFNKVLRMQVWDYSHMPLNFLGQVCLPFSLLWGLLTLPAMGLCFMCKEDAKKNLQ